MRGTTMMILLGAVVSLSGCSSTYYQVKDPTTGKVYYTEKVSTRGSGGAVELKDARTGNTVVLQNSEVHQINEDQFESGRSMSGQVQK